MTTIEGFQISKVERKSLKGINRMHTFIVAGLFICNTACTTLTFKSYGEFPVHVGPKKYHGEIEVYEGEKDFYLWGVIPYEHKIYLDTIMKNYDFVSVAILESEEYQSFGNFILSALSFGLYVPRNYRIKFNGKK